VNKTSFPKIIDKGDLSSAVTFSCQLKFSLLPDEDGSVTVTNVACGFKITQFDVKVLTGANKSLFKMLIGVFKSKLTETVGESLAYAQMVAACHCELAVEAYVNWLASVISNAAPARANPLWWIISQPW
jgi:hypothetical protein